MIISTALRVDAITEISALNPQHARSVANALSARLIRNGAIKFESADQLLELVRSIKAAPIGPDARRVLLDMLTRLREFKRIHVGPYNIATLEDWAGLVRLVLTSHLQITTEYGTTNDPHVVTQPSRLEIASTLAFESSAAFRDLHRFEEQGNLTLGSTRREFWFAALEPLATLSRKIVISDPWVFAPLQKRAAAAPGSDALPQPALPWILGLIDGLDADRPRCVEIYASQKSISEADVRLLSDRYLALGNGSIGSLTVYVGSHDVVAHDRHIRFDCGSAITLGAGLDRLDRPDLRDASGLNWGFRSGAGLDSLRDSEERVKTSRRTSVVAFQPEHQ
ncbi:hypothetical protein [Cryobacterium sp. Hh38]|uniref:hypothetical protein n=1 Tax=Cryobacterium sp. Hh38 TaxID=1259156 RepID=UPI00106B2F62|nr:hypothetical protein [Cryobacterium sp. Hh38]TFD59606.1 hypothetical protein E3T41_11220 [Cryobacterium sp. Hh38]